MQALLKIFLLLFAVTLFSSCLWRRPKYKNWSTDYHPKHHYYKGNNYGGRRLWVRYY
jgi:sterol desaturase/sphingolipid hydroxylase (fatty acid hydroxylase superfamily)